MEENHRKKIEEIIKGLNPKDFKCYKLGFGTFCKGKDIGLESFIECLEKNPGECNFSVSFGNGYMCKCPLRIYIAKELKE